MCSVTAKALSQFEQSHCWERPKHDIFERDSPSLRIDDRNVGITDSESSTPVDPFEAIQNLDNCLHFSVTNQDYDKALASALEIQKHIPRSYYGYLRAAQIYLMRNEYARVLRSYRKGFKTISNSYDDMQLLRKSADDTQHIFDETAMEFAKAGQFDKANRIASCMISLLPSTPAGYLRAGQLYEMQGMFDSAMKSYRQGISAVPKDHRAVLIQRIRSLQEQIDQIPRYDIIVHVPLEITSSIAQYLTLNDLIECLKVSKSWKERIEGCPEVWCVLHIENDGGNFDIAAIQRVKQFVREVILEFASVNPTLVKDLLSSIGDREFEMLKHLSLDHGTMDEQYIPYLARILDSVNLTQLSLTFDFSIPESHIPLHQVLRSCSQLERLVYHSFYFAADIDHKLLPKEPTMITHLSIGAFSYYTEKTEKSHFFIPLIPIFPHLVDLRITYSAPGDLQTISKGCPNLRRLVVVMQNDYEVFQDLPDAENTLKGLQYLKIDGCIDPRDVANVIAQNSKTLLSVDITLQDEDDWDDRSIDIHLDWKHVPKLNCPLLRELHFCVDYFWPLEQWIGDCPSLKDIRVMQLTDPAFDAFRRLPTLRSLYLGNCPDMTDSGLSQFLSDLQKQGSQLDTVAIENCNLMSTNSLLSLIALPCLRSLDIDTCDGITEPVFQDFAAKIGSSSTIESVSLRGLYGVTNQSLLQLIHALPNLLFLNLSCMFNITDDALNTIEDTWPEISISALN